MLGVKGLTANNIINEVLKEDIGLTSILPKKRLVIDQINYARAKVRPTYPVNLDCVLETSYIPNGFLVKDIRFEGSRHLVLAQITRRDY